MISPCRRAAGVLMVVLGVLLLLGAFALGLWSIWTPYREPLHQELLQTAWMLFTPPGLLLVVCGPLVGWIE